MVTLRMLNWLIIIKEEIAMDEIKEFELPSISYILKVEFMEPCGLSAYSLAKSIKVPVSRIQDILHGRRKITAETSLKLAKYFGLNDRFFLDLQSDLDINKARKTFIKDLDEIVPRSSLQYASI